MKKLLRKIWPNKEVLKKDIRVAVLSIITSAIATTAVAFILSWLK